MGVMSPLWTFPTGCPPVFEEEWRCKLPRTAKWCNWSLRISVLDLLPWSLFHRINGNHSIFSDRDRWKWQKSSKNHLSPRTGPQPHPSSISQNRPSTPPFNKFTSCSITLQLFQFSKIQRESFLSCCHKVPATGLVVAHWIWVWSETVANPNRIALCQPGPKEAWSGLTMLFTWIIHRGGKIFKEEVWTQELGMDDPYFAVMFKGCRHRWHGVKEGASILEAFGLMNCSKMAITDWYIILS